MEAIFVKYFVISDIHAHYDAMISALENAGYNSRNQQHHLLILGDLFDRGMQTVKVLEYLYPLSLEDKVTIILGNHDSYLLDFLKGDDSRAYFNILRNGFGETLQQLSGMEPVPENFIEIRENIINQYSFLASWIDSFPLFLEIKDYVFVHGGIDGSIINWQETLTQNDFIWGREIQLQRIPNKIVVAGHHRVATIRKPTEDYHKLFKNHPELFDILYEEGKILIDRFVEVSNEINVLILDL